MRVIAAYYKPPISAVEIAQINEENLTTEVVEYFSNVIFFFLESDCNESLADAWDKGVAAAHHSPLTIFAIKQVNPYRHPLSN